MRNGTTEYTETRKKTGTQSKNTVEAGSVFSRNCRCVVSVCSVSSVVRSSEAGL